MIKQLSTSCGPLRAAFFLVIALMSGQSLAAQTDADPQHAMICWSQAYRLPMLTTDAHGEVRWQVTLVEQAKPAESVYQVADKGYMHLNAEQDIKAD